MGHLWMIPPLLLAILVLPLLRDLARAASEELARIFFEERRKS